MKTTDHFKRTIQAYLEQRAVEDDLFAVTYKKADKNIDDCITYILNEVQRSGCNGFTDGEVYSMAVHYYDEDNIEVGKSMDCRVVVNHVVKLTEDEKAEARQEAIKRMQKEAYAKLTQPKKKTSSRQGSGNENQMTLLF
jgi:hypothetical protein